ncbi:MAG: hypothetical protein ACI9MC_001518 [Kiritimatiellia bacterium]|jgi:hypothetical protein
MVLAMWWMAALAMAGGRSDLSVEVTAAGSPVLTASVVFDGEWETHQVNSVDGTYRVQVLYMTDGTELMVARDAVITGWVQAPGYWSNKMILNIGNKKSRQVAVELQPLDLTPSSMPGTAPSTPAEGLTAEQAIAGARASMLANNGAATVGFLRVADGARSVEKGDAFVTATGDVLELKALMAHKNWATIAGRFSIEPTEELQLELLRVRELAVEASERWLAYAIGSHADASRALAFCASARTGAHQCRE